MDGLTGLKTVAIRLRRPRALRTPWVFLGRPMEERMRVILKKGMAVSGWWYLGERECGLGGLVRWNLLCMVSIRVN